MREETWDFQTPEDKAAADVFMSQGYVLFPVDDAAALARIRKEAVAICCKALALEEPVAADQEEAFLNTVHTKVSPDRLNEVRLAVFHGLNAHAWFRPAYYALGRSMLNRIVGNELAMQRRINLSIQLPHDSSSLLPLHSDVWAGDSPFEVVLWIPLVDVYDSKAMYLLPPQPNEKFHKSMRDFRYSGTEAATHSIEAELQYIRVPYGHALLFNQCLPHGNRVNVESETRWSFNCRFKGLFSPYNDKKLGEFFAPITMRPASRVGLNYQLPAGFDEDGDA